MTPCGRLSTYKKGCRCDLCKQAYRDNWANRSPQRVLDDALLLRKHHLRRTYGLTLEEYDEMFRKQNGKCLICDRPQNPARFRLSVDHNHKTKRVRGLLCHKCNGVLGWYEIYCAEITEYLLFTQGYGDR